MKLVLLLTEFMQKCVQFYYLVAKILLARGRIELPTPCFSDKGKPFGLKNYFLLVIKYP